jgi:hypothetical protein
MDLDDHRLELFDCLVRVLVRRQTQLDISRAFPSSVYKISMILEPAVPHQ